MIEIENLSFAYNRKKDKKQTVYNNFSLHIKEKESWTIVGASGCGKSTLLLLIAGLQQPDSGVIRIAGKEITRPRPATGLVLQDYGLLPWATIADNTRLGLKIRHFYGVDGKHTPANISLNSQEGEARVQYWLHWLGIDSLQNKYPHQLSRGQRQRAAIARTLVLEPDILLMDEPFSALDAHIREELQKVMSRFHQEKKLTCITVTHDIEEAVLLGEKILLMRDGNDGIKHTLVNQFVGAFSSRHSSEFLQQCRMLRKQLSSEKISERESK